MTVTAEAVAGANWGGKTILQGMKSGSGSFPLGTARRLPALQGARHHPGRGTQTFTLDWLKQMTKQMVVLQDERLPDSPERQPHSA